MPKHTRRFDDAGSSLVLALIFLVAVSLVVVALVNWTGNSLRNTAAFVTAHSMETAADNANVIATQYVRFNFIDATLNADVPSPCWTLAASFQSNGQAVGAWCTTYWKPKSSIRVVTISTCLNSVAPTGIACAHSPLLQSTISVNDFNATTGQSNCQAVSTPPAVPTTCGQALTVRSWLFNPTPPSVSSITKAATNSLCSSFANSTSVVIRGSSFTLASDVYFILETSGKSTSSTAYVADKFNVVNDSTINACTPTAALNMGTAFAVVNAPTGVSAHEATSIYSSL